jgi:hypothetical protein
MEAIKNRGKGIKVKGGKIEKKMYREKYFIK